MQISLNSIKVLLKKILLVTTSSAGALALDIRFNSEIPFSILYVFFDFSIILFVLFILFSDKVFKSDMIYKKFFNILICFIGLSSWLICFLNWEFLYHLAIKSWYQFLGKWLKIFRLKKRKTHLPYRRWVFALEMTILSNWNNVFIKKF